MPVFATDNQFAPGAPVQTPEEPDTLRVLQNITLTAAERVDESVYDAGGARPGPDTPGLTTRLTALQHREQHRQAGSRRVLYETYSTGDQPPVQTALGGQLSPPDLGYVTPGAPAGAATAGAARLASTPHRFSTTGSDNLDGDAEIANLVMRHGVRDGGPTGINFFMGYPVVSAAGFTAAQLMAVLSALLPLSAFARGAVYKGKSPAGQLTSIAEEFMKKTHLMGFVNACQKGSTLEARTQFGQGFEALCSAETTYSGPAMDFIVIYALVMGKDSNRKTRALNALKAYLLARPADLQQLETDAHVGAAGISVGSEGAEHDVRSQPGYARLDPMISQDRKSLHNPSFDSNWRSLVMLLAYTVTYTPAKGDEITKIVAKYTIMANDPYKKHPLYMRAKESFLDLFQRHSQYFDECKRDLQLMGNTDRIPTEEDRLNNLIRAMQTRPEMPQKIQDRVDRGNHRRDGAKWDRHFLLKLAQETTNTATEVPEVFKQVLSASGAAGQPAGVPAGDKGKKFQRQKVPETGFTWKQADNVYRYDPKYREAMNASKAAVSLAATYMAPDEPDLPVDPAVKAAFDESPKTFHAECRERGTCLNCGQKPKINGKSIRPHKANECPFERPDGQVKKRKGNRIVPDDGQNATSLPFQLQPSPAGKAPKEQTSRAIPAVGQADRPRRRPNRW